MKTRPGLTLIIAFLLPGISSQSFAGDRAITQIAARPILAPDGYYSSPKIRSIKTGFNFKRIPVMASSIGSHAGLKSLHDRFEPHNLNSLPAELERDFPSVHVDGFNLTPDAQRYLHATVNGLLIPKTSRPHALKKMIEQAADQAGPILYETHFRYLAENSDAVSTTLKTYLIALDLELAIDAEKTNHEQSDLIKNLLKTMDSYETSFFLNQTVAYRINAVRPTDYYGFLQTLCGMKGIDLSHYPALSGYVRYLFLSDALDTDQLIHDLKDLERLVLTSAGSGA